MLVGCRGRLRASATTYLPKSIESPYLHHLSTKQGRCKYGQKDLEYYHQHNCQRQSQDSASWSQADLQRRAYPTNVLLDCLARPAAVLGERSPALWEAV